MDVGTTTPSKKSSSMELVAATPPAKTAKLDDATPPDLKVAKAVAPDMWSEGLGRMHISMSKERTELTSFLNNKRVHVVTISRSQTKWHGHLVANVVRLAREQPIDVQQAKTICKMQLQDIKGKLQDTKGKLQDTKGKTSTGD
jgi:hypothetical protein